MDSWTQSGKKHKKRAKEVESMEYESSECHLGYDDYLFDMLRKKICREGNQRVSVTMKPTRYGMKPEGSKRAKGIESRGKKWGTVQAKVIRFGCSSRGPTSSAFRRLPIEPESGPIVSWFFVTWWWWIWWRCHADRWRDDVRPHPSPPLLPMRFVSSLTAH